MGQADWLNAVSYGDSIVHLQHCYVVSEGGERKVMGEELYHVSRYRRSGVIAAVMLAQCHFYHKPHESE